MIPPALPRILLLMLVLLQSMASGAEEMALVHGSWVESVVFTPDGKQLVSTGFDNLAKLWEPARTNAPLRIFGEKTEGPQPRCFMAMPRLLSAAFTAGGSRLLTCGQYNAVRLWDFTNAAAESQVIEGKGDWHRGTISPDGRWVLAAGIKAAALWELPNGKARILPHPAVVEGVCFSHDGTRFLTGCQDRQVRLWKTADPSAPLAIFPHPSWVGTVAFSPDDRRILTGCDDFKARLWDAAATTAPVAVFAAHTAYVKAVAFSSDGTRIATAGNDNTARLWDVTNTNAPLQTFRHPGWVRALAFSPDGKRLATGCYDYKVRLWEIEKAQGREP